MVELADVRAARTRIEGYVRRTPLVAARPTKQPAMDNGALFLKLENLQITGSFKPRGAVNKLRTLSDDEIARGIITASGGNHGLAVAYIGWIAGVPATVYLPDSAPAVKAEKLESWGARVIREGEAWDDANQAALAAAEREGLTYSHPFADPAVIAGQGTIGLEILEDVPEVDTLLVAIGGGGLISGISLAAKAIRPAIKMVGVEPVGAPTLYESLQAGHLVTLSEIRTVANTLASRESAAINFDIIQQHVDEIVLVTDDEMREAARWLWLEMGVAAELSGAAAVAALMAGKVQPAPSENVCAVVCGVGTDGIVQD